MPSWDMSWDDLQLYEGTTPRPPGFDQYWQSTLDELAATPADVTVEPVDMGYRSARCDDLWFTGIGGARVYAKYVRPTQPDGNGRAIAVFHGYRGRSHDWFELLPYAAEGLTVLALDCRGQGGRSLDEGAATRSSVHGHIVRGLHEGPSQLLYRRIFADTVRTAQILMESADVDPARVGSMGWSQGGGLALACAALEPRVAATAATFPFLCDYRRVWELDLAQDAYAELVDWLRLFDPMHERIDEFFDTLGHIDVQHLAPRIRAATLLVTCLADRICPPSTQFAAFNKITAEKRVVAFPDYGHEDLPEQRDLVLRHLREHL